MANGSHNVYRFDTSGKEDLYLESNWNYFVLEKSVYSSRYGVVVRISQLDDIDCRDLWLANWENSHQRHYVLTTLGGKRFWKRCKSAWEDG